MAYLYDVPNSTTGFDAILVDTAREVPALGPFILFFVFMVVFLGGIMRQKARVGTADYAMWSVVASIGTLIIALIMSTIVGVIRLDWLVIVVVVTLLSGIWLFLDRKPSEL